MSNQMNTPKGLTEWSKDLGLSQAELVDQSGFDAKIVAAIVAGRTMARAIDNAGPRHWESHPTTSGGDKPLPSIISSGTARNSAGAHERVTDLSRIRDRKSLRPCRIDSNLPPDGVDRSEFCAKSSQKPP